MFQTPHDRRNLATALLLMASCTASAAEFELPLSLDAWTAKSFKGETLYSVGEEDGKTTLCARADGTASALLYEHTIKLKDTPLLQWSWKVVEALPAADEKTKATDDFSARLYVLHSSGLWKFGLRALNYVWSTTAPVGQSWPNPFAGKRAMMLPLRSGQPTGWTEESRDVAADFKMHLDRNIDEIHGLAIMTDADNSGGKAAACFRDIRFSPR